MYAAVTRDEQNAADGRCSTARLRRLETLTKEHPKDLLEAWQEYVGTEGR